MKHLSHPIFSFCILYASVISPDVASGSALINITENTQGVTIHVQGTINPNSVTRITTWTHAFFVDNNWSNADPNANDQLQTGNNNIGRYRIDGAVDTGYMTTDSTVEGGVLTGTGYSIGTSYYGGEVSLLLDDTLGTNTMDYSVFFAGRTLEDFDLEASDSRILTFDDGNGSGGRESIEWNVSYATPDPSVSISQHTGLHSISFYGVLQSSPDLINWTTLDPQPESPYVYTPIENCLFFRALSE